MNRKITITASLVTVAMLSGCAGIPLSSTRFSGSSNLAPESVQTGVVIRTMPIKINNPARVDQATGLGAGAGGLVGYLAGGNVIGALAGAVGGGVIGDAITPNAGVGTDVFVKLSTGQTLSIPEAGIVHLIPGEHVFVMTSAHGHYRVEPANKPAAPVVKP